MLDKRFEDMTPRDAIKLWLLYHFSRYAFGIGLAWFFIWYGGGCN